MFCSWICATGSPCYAVIPTFPEAAQYFFVARFNTAGANTQTTYCAYTTDVSLRLVGLPVPPAANIAAFVATMFAGMGIAVVAAYFFYLKPGEVKAAPMEGREKKEKQDDSHMVKHLDR